MNRKSDNSTSLLDPSLLSRLNSLELISRKVVEGFMVGIHKSPYHGFSAEFSEYRPYQKGDSIKDIDWKVFGRSDKYIVKKYEEETNLICHVLLDSSLSMDYKHTGTITKLQYAKILAASLIQLLLTQRDSAGLVTFSDKITSYFTPKSTLTYRKELYKGLQDTIAGGETNTAFCINQVAEKIKKRGLVVIISDFLDSLEGIVSAIKHLHYKKNEVLVFQVLDPSELDFNFGSEAIFLDKETNEELTTQPSQLQKEYQRKVQEFLNSLKQQITALGLEYNLIKTTDTLDLALLEYFKKRAKLH